MTTEQFAEGLEALITTERDQRLTHDTTDTDVIASLLPRVVYTFVVRDGVNVRRPGIYLWEIEGGEKYVGKYKQISRPTQHYSRNVARLLAGLPYRKGKPDEFRRIHRALGDAARKGLKVTLTILANANWGDELNRLETKLISELGGTLNGASRSR